MSSLPSVQPESLKAVLRGSVFSLIGPLLMKEMNGVFESRMFRETEPGNVFLRSGEGRVRVVLMWNIEAIIGQHLLQRVREAISSPRPH